MPIQRLADLSGAVVVARIAGATPRRLENPTRIETELILSDVEFLKGAPPVTSSQLRLIVPGGRVGDLELRLCCAPEFTAGQKWLLFLLPEYRVHPVAGMGQGAFRIIEDAGGVERVYQSGTLAVARLGADGFVQVGHATREAHSRPIETRGVRVKMRSGRDQTPVTMSLDAFRKRIQPILDRSRRYVRGAELSVRREPDFSAVRLRSARQGKLTRMSFETPHAARVRQRKAKR